MANILDALAIELGFDTSNLKVGAAEANTILENAVRTFAKQSKEIEAEAKKIADNITGFRLAVVAFVYEASKQIDKFVKAIEQMNPAMASFGRTAESLGMTSKELGTLGNAIEQHGGDIDSLAQSFSKLQDEVEAWKHGSTMPGPDSPVWWWNSFRINSRDALGDIRKPQEALNELNKSALFWQKTPQDQRFLLKKMGVDEKNLTPILELLREAHKTGKSFIEVIDAAGKANAPTTAQTDNQKALQKAWGETAQAWRSIVRDLLDAVTPKLIELFNAMSRFFVGQDKVLFGDKLGYHGAALGSDGGEGIAPGKPGSGVGRTGGARLGRRTGSRAEEGEQKAPTTGGGAVSGELDRGAYEKMFAGTPLAGKYDKVVEEANRQGISPALMAAVMAHETGKGTSSALRNKNNPGGVSGAGAPITFGSLDEGLAATAETIARNYRRGGGTLEGLGEKYAPTRGATNDPRGLNKDWLPGVRKFLGDLGGKETAKASEISPAVEQGMPGPITPGAVTAVGGAPPKAFIVHHTSGGGDIEGVKATLDQRGLGVEYAMDRQGNIRQIGGPGAQNIRDSAGPFGTELGKKLDLSNKNIVGMEVIAKDDRDVTPAQVAAARKFIETNYPNTPVYGHGEVNRHKEPEEGMTIVRAIRRDRGMKAPEPVKGPYQIPHDIDPFGVRRLQEKPPPLPQHVQHTDYMMDAANARALVKNEDNSKNAFSIGNLNIQTTPAKLGEAGAEIKPFIEDHQYAVMATRGIE